MEKRQIKAVLNFVDDLGDFVMIVLNVKNQSNLPNSLEV